MPRSMPMAIDNLKIQATVVVLKKSSSEYNDPNDVWSGPADTLGEALGQKISLRLVSADKTDPMGAKIGAPIHLENWNEKSLFRDITFHVAFDWSEDFGTPGAILVQNPHHGEFYLKTVTLEDVPARGRIHFICNSWIYNCANYKTDRVFFSIKAYLPHEMPEPLRKYREEELRILRGNGEGELKKWDRVYDYALYNDLGNPDKSLELDRPILGRPDNHPFHPYPYPRRGRTGRKPSNSDPKTESRNFPLDGKFNIYVPRDEQFGRLKKKEFTDNNQKASFFHGAISKFGSKVLNDHEFDSFKEVDDLYFKEDPEPLNQHTSDILNALFNTAKKNLKFPSPQVIKADRTAWRTDEEFAREMVAGVNPLLIRLLQEFPPTSKLDPVLYGDQHSSITKQDIEYNLGGLTVEEALKRYRLFILDHHDTVIPYLWKINKDTETRIYASRTLLFLKDDNRLKPVAIELSLPDEKGDKFGVVRKVYTPAENGVEGSIWQLAKAYVAVVDTGHHQLISHWLNTHAVIEPFVIATNTQLSVVHPIYKLLHPHFRDTMAINALAREILVNAGGLEEQNTSGLVEQTFYPAKYSTEMSSEIYKSWNFLDQALPSDLKKRGIAVGDINSLADLDQLLIKDYPYAVDGLKIWFAIEKWVRDYCSIYYKTDNMVQQDPELQAWWEELREKGHADKKDETWWPKMQTCKELIESCTIIIWIASALHAAVNFGQYAYGGYSPNRPTLSHRFMPEKSSPEYAELEKNPDKAFLNTFTPQLQCLIGITLVEVLSQQSSDEVYLGQREPEWTKDVEAVKAFKDFHDRLAKIEDEIKSMNEDKKLKNRVGPVNVPYTLLFPTGEVGLSGKGIPNSISI